MIDTLKRLFQKKSKAIDFANCNEKQLTKFLEANERTEEDKATKDYTSQYWGHTCVTDDMINDDPPIWKMHGFDGTGQVLRMSNLPTYKLRVGDEVLLNVEQDKVGIYFILTIEFSDDPSDMFFGTMVGIGYKGD